MENKNDTSYQLMHAFIRLHRQKMHAGPIAGLNRSEMAVLRSISKLDKENGVKVSELSTYLKVSAPSITQTVNGLVKQDLVKRCPDSSDRRAIRLIITFSGKEKLSAAFEEFRLHFYGLCQYLGQSKSNQLIDLLNEVYNFFEGEN
ncbi:MarR family transcriptional regulator [Proteinivorax tanatarense]|uniref:MarR family transcriptional regulator n=1 Tax=Proteinivorax tanatarense TaxID=1260629 RepID=A0AAU7VKY4_9FIRM